MFAAGRRVLLLCFLIVLWSFACGETVQFTTTVSFRGEETDAACGQRTAICTCGKSLDPTAVLPELQPCGLTSALVSVVKSPGTVSDEDLVASVQTALHPVRGLRVIATSDAPLSCVDHRAKHEIVGSWGGSVAEMVLALTVGGKLRGKPASQEDIHAFVQVFVEKTRAPFVDLHTDVDAMAYIQQESGVVFQNILDASESEQEAIMSTFVNSQAHGCHVIRRLLERPTEFNVVSDVVVGVVKSLHLLLWRGEETLAQKIKYHVYEPRTPSIAAPADANDVCLTSTSQYGGYSFGILRANGSAAVTHSLQLQHFPRAFPTSTVNTANTAMLVKLELPQSCHSRRQSAVMVAPAVAGVAQPQLHIIQQHVIAAHRNATAYLLANFFGVGVDEAKIMLQDVGREWDDLFAAEEATHLLARLTNSE